MFLFSNIRKDHIFPPSLHLAFGFSKLIQLLLKTLKEEGRSQGLRPFRSAEQGGLATGLRGIPSRGGTQLSQDSKAATSPPPPPTPGGLRGAHHVLLAQFLITWESRPSDLCSFSPPTWTLAGHLLGTRMGAWQWGWEDDRKLRAWGTQTWSCVLSELLLPCRAQPQSLLLREASQALLWATPPLCVLRALRLLIALLLIMTS